MWIDASLIHILEWRHTLPIKRELLPFSIQASWDFPQKEVREAKVLYFANRYSLIPLFRWKNKNLSVLILSCLCFLFLVSFLLSLRPVGGGPNPIGNLDRGSPYHLADLDWWSKPAGAQTRKETGIGNPVGASEFILGFICNCFKNYFLTAKISFTCVPNLVSFNTS